MTGFFQYQVKKHLAEAMPLIQQQVEFPGETLIFNIQGDNKRFSGAFTTKDGLRIL